MREGNLHNKETEQQSYSDPCICSVHSQLVCSFPMVLFKFDCAYHQRETFIYLLMAIDFAAILLLMPMPLFDSLNSKCWLCQYAHCTSLE